MSAAEVRPLSEGDWPAVLAIFRDVGAAGDTYAYPDGLTSDEARALWVESPPGHAVVALRDGLVLEKAKYGPNRPGRGAHIATASFMVSPEAQGSGVGRSPCDYVIAQTRDAGFAVTQTQRCQPIRTLVRCIAVSASSPLARYREHFSTPNVDSLAPTSCSWSSEAR